MTLQRCTLCDMKLTVQTRAGDLCCLNAKCFSNAQAPNATLREIVDLYAGRELAELLEDPCAQVDAGGGQLAQKDMVEEPSPEYDDAAMLRACLEVETQAQEHSLRTHCQSARSSGDGAVDTAPIVDGAISKLADLDGEAPQPSTELVPVREGAEEHAVSVSCRGEAWSPKTAATALAKRTATHNDDSAGGEQALQKTKKSKGGERKPVAGSLEDRGRHLSGNWGHGISTVPCEIDVTQSMWCTTDREHGKLNHSDVGVIDLSPVSTDESPLIKKPRRRQEAQRPCYGLVRLRIARYESSAALEAASSGDLSTQFIADYPRYKGMPENVAAGYLLAHLAVRRALGILRREERDLFDGLPESSDWSFTWAPVELEGHSQLIWQIAQAFSNWSPVLLDMDDIAQEDEGMGAKRKRYDDADPIPYRRSQCQVMSQKTIHDCDKPQFPGDISVRDAYGQASLRGFFAQKTWQTRVAVVHTGTLGRSVSLQACWGENREVSSQNQLDSFLKSVASTFKKPRNADYSTKTSSIIKGARGYVGRRFDVALETLEACYEKKSPLQMPAQRS